MSTEVRYHAVGQPAGPTADAPADDPAWREGLEAAFWRYERALLANDLEVLDELFLDDPGTLRADGAGVLVGHAQISLFRRSRGAGARLPGARTVERLHVQVHGPAAALLIAEVLRDEDGARGLQTQLWTAVGTDGDGPRWRVVAAHVSASPTGAPAASSPVGPASSSGPRSSAGSVSPSAGSAAGAAPDETSAVWRVRGGPLVAGAGEGPLRGLTVAVKDLFAVQGHRTGAGNPVWLAEAAPEPEHAPAVAALLAAGADVAGIAQTDELAYSLSGTNVHYGTPPNPTAPGVVPGGSTSGPASAVALGLVDVGLGTDTGGSVRVPASYCGLFGIRPTHGAVSAAGLVPLAPSFDTVGWLTRDADLLARAGGVLLPPADPAAPTPTRLLVADDLVAVAEPEVAAALAAVLPALAAAVGLPTRHVPQVAGARLDDWVTAFRQNQGWEANATHGAWVAAHPGALGPGVAGRFAAAAAVTEGQLRTAQRVRAQARDALAAALAGGTVLVAPASSSPAPRMDLAVDVKDRVRAATLTLTAGAGLAGLPVVVLPMLRVRDRPVGVALIGAAGTDRALLALATRAAAACPPQQAHTAD
ncbi:amidase [Frankia sp. AgB1.9]|uniref:amidase n=1 Tax=unclassified Frankia TaxID=2632575 RepID=UPI0019320737|nr:MULTISPECIES: amidase [unclassified Frankia]MBL7489821.1 amidase [Frankia sp. AgW1.1]MBL7548187.1 amidase [Frankia sp. AgB1.9]MBL7623792.1 amidase [Frankia sp. AgB1.8]